MKIACPDCNAAYDVPPTQLAPGRPARCARCGAVWTPVATEDAKPPIPAAVVEPRQPPPSPPEPAPAPRPEPPPDLAPDRAAAGEADAPHGRDNWHIVPPVPEPGFDDVPDPVSASPAREAAASVAPAPQRRAGVPVLAGWLLTVVVLVVLGTLAVSQRDAIIAAWPASERAYRAIGLAH